MELGRRRTTGLGHRFKHHWWWLDLKILYRAVRNAREHNITGTAAQLAFEFTFCFFPMLMVIAFLLTTIEAPFLFARIMVALHTVLPPSAVALVEQVLNEVRKGASWQLFFTGLGLGVWSAVNGLHVLICSINCAHDVSDHRPYWKRSLIALGLTLVLAVLLIAATALVIGGNWLGLRLVGWLGLNSWLLTWWAALRWPVIVLAVVVGFVVLYTAAPNLPISAWRALPGAILGGSGWVASTTLFAWYINNFASYNRVYGSIGGMIVLMLWLYVASIAVLFGAEVNGALYRRRHGHT